MITCNHLKLRYRGANKNALNDISIHIPAGKTVAIVGHNGAGKSTLIKAIVGLVACEGEIKYGFDKKELHDNIHVQMQTSHFDKGMRVKDIIVFYLKVNKSEESIDELLVEFNLASYKNTLIERLSGGERQRLAILLVLIGNSKVIIFDEITTGLDSVARRQVWDLLKKIKTQRDLTIVLTSHFLEEVQYLADEVIIIKEGKLVAEGTVDAMIQSAFGNTREIHCLVPEDIQLNELGIDFKLNQNELIIEYDIRQEYELYTLLNNLGCYHIEIKQRSFEDAFLKISGYRLGEKGEPTYE